MRGCVPDRFQGFRSNLRALLVLGVVFVAGITVAVMSTALVDGGKLLDTLTAPAPTTAEEREAWSATLNATLLDGRTQAAMLFAVLVALPIALFWIRNPEWFLFRSRQVSIFTQGSWLGNLGTSIGATIGMFLWRGDSNWRHNIAGVAQSVYHDIAPAAELGFRAVRVNRRSVRSGLGSTPVAEAKGMLEIPDLSTLMGLVREAGVLHQTDDSHRLT